VSVASEEKEHISHASPMRYVVCWLALAVFTGLTYYLSGYEFGEWSLVIALLIACAKAGVVALFFMHLWDHRGASRLVFAVSVIFLVVLITIVLIDQKTRFPLALPPH
jgi:cytochrome c oxidase subunit 4